MPGSVILIADDDRTTVRLCQRLLERSAYQVIIAVDPIDALKILEWQKVDLLLSDIRMPAMDGFELISQAKKIQPDMPVLVMTGYGSMENAIQALHEGVDGLIVKPFENSAKLVQTVQRVLEESRQRRNAARLQALRPLFDVTERLLAETSPHALEKLILNSVTGLFQAVYAEIYRMGVENAVLEVVGVSGKPHSASGPLMQQDLVEMAIAEGSPVLINVSGFESYEAMQSLMDDLGWESLMVAPIRRNNNQIIFCACREKGSLPFTEADLEMFVILARQAAVAMENARLYSELKDYVRRIEESQRALIQAEKMAAVGRLMASLAHEINNPLQSLRNCLHLATRKGINTEERLRYLDMTDSQLERLVITVRRMLDFYRPGGVEKEKSDIRQIMDQVIALLKVQLKQQGILYNIQYHGMFSPIFVVPDQIQQVIFNLMINAIDVLNENESAISTEMNSNGSVRQEKTVWVDVFYETKRVRILIEDSGPGILAEVRGRIFEPFVSTKQQGTGLGLAVSYSIIEQHQGSLTVIPPQYEEGACFEIILPLGVEGVNGKDTDR